MFRRTLISGVVLLALFHGWLFGSQVWDGQLADLGLLARWTVAGGLFLGLMSLRRQGRSVVRGRKAVAIWLLAALLHGPAIGDRVGSDSVPAVPEIVAVLTSATLAGCVALGLVLLAGLSVTSRRQGQHRLQRGRTDTTFIPSLLDLHPAFSPRPPPVA